MVAASRVLCYGAVFIRGPASLHEYGLVKGTTLRQKTQVPQCFIQIASATISHRSSRFAQGSPLVMPMVTRFLSYASHPFLLLIARLTSSCKKKQPIVPGCVSTRANDPCRYWEVWHHPENIDAIIACFVWRDTHHLCAMETAAALSFVQLADYKRRRRH